MSVVICEMGAGSVVTMVTGTMEILLDMGWVRL